MCGTKTAVLPAGEGHPRHRLKLKMKKRGYQRGFQKHVQPPLPPHVGSLKRGSQGPSPGPADRNTCKDYKGVVKAQTEIRAREEGLKARPSGLVSLRGPNPNAFGD